MLELEVLPEQFAHGPHQLEDDVAKPPFGTRRVIMIGIAPLANIDQPINVPLVHQPDGKDVYGRAAINRVCSW